MSRSPHDLLVERHKPYRQAFERVQRAVEARHRAQERLQELERKLAAAEGRDFERLHAAVDAAKQQAEAAANAAERVGREFDGMPAEHRSDWLRAASKEFQSARADYERRINLLAEARERLAQEAALVSFLVDGQMSSISSSTRARSRA